MTTAREENALQAAEAFHEDTLDRLCRLIGIPSVSTSGTALQAAADTVAELAADAGFEVEQWETPGAPVVFARIPAPEGAPTLLFYGHYDVQPPDPLAAWTSPPFEADVRNGAVYGRGAGDNKGQFLAHIMAARALSVTGGSPVGIKLLIEGEEEIGSPNLETTVAERREQLRCDVAITADGPYHTDGRPLVILGVRGLLYIEATATGAGRDAHSGSRGGIAPTPARALTRALATLWNDDDRVAVDGFYSDVRRPSTGELELAASLPFDEAALRRELQTEVLPDYGGSPWATLMFEPNLNIAGLFGGYTDPGMKTIVPHRVTAKIDVRLVADQDPENILSLLRQHFDAYQVTVEKLAAVPPSSTPVDTPFAAPVIRAVERAWSAHPWIQPRLGGTTPDYVFTRILGVPSILVPYAPADMQHHAPDEHLQIEALWRGIRTSVTLCIELGDESLG